ncbi:uncharacterized protein [Parasteatoda tepidariorum]|nr:uncharacterized protein LOC107441036 isoform X2 [Parasteatoda tepidariorum]XP_015909670.1 uncharacterized protein LOC107441036 isoform X2 [Parasteatoda tepidariorum]
MMTKMTDFRIRQLMLVLIYYIISLAASENEGTNYLLREKRNILCYLGVNEVLKSVLYDSLEDLHKNDPIKLGNSSSNKLEDGVLQGLSTLTNVSDLNVECEDDSLVFSTILGMKDAVVHFKWHRKFLVNLEGTVWSRADEVNFDVQVRLNITEAIRFDVDRVLVTKLEGFRFGFSGLGPLNPLVKGFVKIMQKIWSTKITKVIQKLLKKALEKQLSKLTFSF